MKYNNVNENINKFKSSTIKNLNGNSIKRNINRNKSPQYFIRKNIFKKSFTRENNSRPNIPKITSNYEGSIYNINSLIDKMNSLKQLMYRTTDLNSMLVMDKYGLKYANDLRRNINSANKLMSPHHQENKKYNHYETNNLNYFKGIRIKNDFKKNSKRFEKELINLSKDFDLTSININNIKKEKIKNVLEEEKKDKKLYHLKTELFLLDQNNKIKNSYVSENNEDKNLTFIRDKTTKDNIYSQVKSKFRKQNNKIKRNLLLTLSKTDEHNKFKNLLNSFNENSDIIKINENEEDDDFEVEQDVKQKNKISFLKNDINSYKIKIQNSNKSENNNKNIIRNSFNQYMKAPLSTSLNLTLSKNNMNNNIKKISLTHLTTSNNSQENTCHNSPNSSFITKEMIYPKYKNTMKIVKNNITSNNINGPLNNFKKQRFKPKKFHLIKKINTIMDKSNSIKKSFINISDESKKIKKKLFSKHNYKYNLNRDMNIDLDRINKYFKFSKRDDIDENKLIKENANRIKTFMDNKCSKLLDCVVNELIYQDRKLNKGYLGMSSYEKKVLKIKREDDIKKIGNENVLVEKELQKDKILDIFLPENQEIVDLLKENNNKHDDTELLYIKSKILKHLNRK